MDELAEVCDRQRRYARAHPITMASLNVAQYKPTLFNPYRFTVNHQYDCLVFYEVFRRPDIAMQPPLWHVQLTILEVVGELEFGAVQQAMVACKDWFPEQAKVASDIIGEVLAPEVIKHTQEVHVHQGLWSIHYFTPDLRGDDAQKAN